MKWVYLIVTLVVVSHGQDEGSPCVPRNFGYSSFVCVCNSTHCDTMPRPTIPPKGDFLVYTSDLTDKRFAKSQHSFGSSGNGLKAETVNYTLASTSYQTIIGWGGAFTDVASAHILSLSPVLQDMLLSSYFSDTGIEYNLGRINMGGCDFSWRPYTYADTEGDVELMTFALQPEDLDYKIPVIKRAAAMTEKGIKIYASPWTAPPWMKTNNNYVGYGQLLEEMYQPWAEYFVKFLQSYESQNISIWGLTAQNEPTNGYIPGFNFNCMGWTAEEQRKWVAENLGPTLAANGFDDVVLMIMDGQRFDLPNWPITVLNDSAAAQYVDGIAVHWYGDGVSDPARLNDTNDLFPNHFIFGTEACAGFGSINLGDHVHLGEWERLESYAHDIIVDMNHWMTGWTDWNLALDMEGGPNWANMAADSPIIVNVDADEFYKNPMFYAMGHFSKFVKEGARRLDLTSADPLNLEATAFWNEDGSRAIVILNRDEADFEVRVEVETRGTMTLTVGPRSLQTAIFI